MNIIDKGGEHIDKFKSTKRDRYCFLWEKVEINQDLIKANSVLEEVRRTEVVYVNVRCKETLCDLS